MSFISKAKNDTFCKISGADAVKFQTYKASLLASKIHLHIGIEKKRKLLANISFFQSTINLKIKIIKFYKNIAKRENRFCFNTF